MNKLIRPFYEAIYKARGFYPATIAGQDYKLDPYHIKFWRKAARGDWEPNTFKILSTYLKKDSVYCDIGAWIGPTVTYAARHCKQVICFEPDPTAYRYLRWNIDLNQLDNVSSYSIALADSFKVSSMSSFGHELGDSMSSLLCKNTKGKTVNVLQMPWQQFLEASQLQQIDLLKIDIEGGEFSLLPAIKDYLAEHKPTLYLSTHAPFLDSSERKAKMEQIIEAVKVYKTCLNDEQQEIDLDELLSDEALNTFNSYIFKD